MEDNQVQDQAQRIEELIHELEVVPDPDSRAKTLELVQLLMDFHCSGLERVMDLVAKAGDPGYAIFEDFAHDELVSNLLLLYGLHPLELEVRVIQALEKVRPYLGSHGGNVELLGIKDGVIRLRMIGSCHSCPSSAKTLKLAIEEAIYEAAPDATAIEVEGVVESLPTPAFVQLGGLSSRGGAPQSFNGNHNGSLEKVTGLDLIGESSARTQEVRGDSISFNNAVTNVAEGKQTNGTR